MSKHFNAYLCNVCFTKESFNQSKLCTKCKLVSYCGPNHQKKDWANHKVMCKAAQKLCLKQKTADPFMVHFVFPNVEIYTYRKPPQPSKSKWFCNAYEVQCLMQKHLKRPLNLFQNRMLFFGQHCNICCSRDVVKDLVCKRCFGVGYCSSDHQLLDKDKHKQVCQNIEESLKMDLFLPSVDLEALRKQIPLLKAGQIFDTMKSIVNTIKPEWKFEQKAFASFCLTDVLTFAYYINEFKGFTIGKKLIVHIVGATRNRESCGIEFWENLLHLFPRSKHLVIVFIGYEVKDETYSSIISRLCDDCKKANKKIDSYSYKQFYHEYYKSGFLMKPDAIILYNSGLHVDIDTPDDRDDTWKESIPLFFSFKVPFIATAGFKSDAEQDYDRLLREGVPINEKLTVVAKCEKNPFNNMWPYRNWMYLAAGVDSGIIFKNSYVSALKVG